MPVYEYCCNSCSNQFELRQKFSDPPADSCPKCGGTVRKLVSAVSFSLKGSGWFGDGYGAKVESAPTENESAGAGAAKTKTEGLGKETTSAEASKEAQISTPSQNESNSPATEAPAKEKTETTSKDE